MRGIPDRSSASATSDLVQPAAFPAPAGRLVRRALAGALLLLAAGCSTPAPTLHVPPGGYAWPDAKRADWPTDGWRTAAPAEHGIDEERLAEADAFARNDPLTRCLLVVRHGRVVFERSYGGGAPDRCANLWSVTKSVTSAVVGLLFTRGLVKSVDEPMTAYLPGYPTFGDITIRHVLTHTTGLRWSEEGLPWVDWIRSDDWVAEALARGRDHVPGEVFRYSSANTQFLCALVHAASGRTPGELAEEGLFRPLGIPFHRMTEPQRHDHWDAFKPVLDHGWRQDPSGLETGGFGLYLTPRDVAKLGFLYLNRGVWDGRRILSREWIEASTRDQRTDVYGRYSYGYQWWIARVDGEPCFLASGLGGQILGVVPSLDLVLVIAFEAMNPVHPVPGSAHDDMRLFELVVRAVRR